MPKHIEAVQLLAQDAFEQHAAGFAAAQHQCLGRAEVRVAEPLQQKQGRYLAAVVFAESRVHGWFGL